MLVHIICDGGGIGGDRGNGCCLQPCPVTRVASGGNCGGSEGIPTRKYASVRMICDGGGGRGNGGNGGCLQPCFVIRDVSEGDWGGPEVFSTRKYVSNRDICVGGEGRCAWVVNSLKE